MALRTSRYDFSSRIKSSNRANETFVFPAIIFPLSLSWASPGRHFSLLQPDTNDQIFAHYVCAAFFVNKFAAPYCFQLFSCEFDIVGNYFCCSRHCYFSLLTGLSGPSRNLFHPLRVPTFYFLERFENLRIDGMEMAHCFTAHISLVVNPRPDCSAFIGSSGILARFNNAGNFCHTANKNTFSVAFRISQPSCYRHFVPSLPWLWERTPGSSLMFFLA